ncbi:MAG: DNA-directed RNA polymerase subunit delta [Bacilli bacterium]|nr:DNA-directed RNA polymerase subunit delta [Bacilli bacterium]
MKIKLKKEELEVLTYTDIAEIILNNSKKPLKTADLFKEICDLLELSEESYKNEIGDFYTSLTTDKRFVSLENALWDLRDRHAINIEFSEDDEDEESEEEEDIEEEKEDENELDEIDEDLDVDDDDMDELSIVSEDELEEEE